MSNLTLLTTAAVARRLDIPRREVVRAVERGDLAPAGKLEGRTGAYLFDPEPIAAFDAERRAS